MPETMNNGMLEDPDYQQMILKFLELRDNSNTSNAQERLGQKRSNTEIRDTEEAIMKRRLKQLQSCSFKAVPPRVCGGRSQQSREEVTYVKIDWSTEPKVKFPRAF